MKLNSIAIRLKGKCDVEKLASLGFRKINSGWMFDGKLHRYIFTARGHAVLITIVPRPLDWRMDAEDMPDHRITFRNFDDWLLKCVNIIELR